MPLRFLDYIAKEYQKLCFSKSVYSEKPVELPTPEFYVLYNGAKDAPLEQTLKLSDTFIGECDTISLELIVKVINVNYDKGAEILDRCKTLREYSLFMHKIRTYRMQCGDLSKAVEMGIRECINEGILSEFLARNKGDVMSFIELQLSAEEREAIREEDGYTRGVEEGAERKAKEIARNLKEAGLSIDVISKNTGLDIEEIESL